MFLKNVNLLYGTDLKFIPSTNVSISENFFKKIGANLHPNKNEKIFDCTGLLMIPGFINSHTHIGDSIAKDFFS